MGNFQKFRNLEKQRDEKGGRKEFCGCWLAAGMLAIVSHFSVRAISHCFYEHLKMI